MKRTVCLNPNILPLCANRRKNRCYYSGDCFLKEELIDGKSDIELQADEVERIGSENLKVKEPQVDFGMLNKSLQCWFASYNSEDERGKNVKLFFQLLSIKPTFANVAYRELNKLNK